MLEKILLEQTNKVDLMLKKDLNEKGMASNITRKEGLIVGLLTLQNDISSEIAMYCESRDKEKLEIIKLMMHDNAEYINRLLESE